MTEPPFGLRERLADTWAEHVRSIESMSARSRILWFLAIAAFLLATCWPHPWSSQRVMAAVRVPLMAAVLIGGFINARHAEEFVRKAYLDACAIAVPVSVVFFYAVVEFRIPFARFAAVYLLTIWLACWIVASARLQRT